MSLLLSLPLLLAPADGPYPVGQVSVAYPGPGGTATAEVYYPATSAGPGAPLAPLEGGHPLVVFGHGYLIPASAYGYLVDGLVPEGFVVAMLTTGGELFPDHAQFGQDFRTTAQGLFAEATDPGSLFFEGLNGRAAAVGHSMGGGASFLAAAGNEVFAAVANLAAADTNPSAQAAAASVTQPLLMLSGGDDCVTPPAQQQAIWDAAASSCKHWVTLEGGSHCAFASSSSACNIGELFCSSSLAGSAQRQLVVDLLTPWLRAVLAVEADAWGQFEERLQTTAGLATSASCGTELAIDSVGGLDAQIAGFAEVVGSELDWVVGAEVDGAAVPFERLDATSIELSLDSSAPGAFDLELVDLFGSLAAPEAVRRHPALIAGPAALGGTLELTLDAGLATTYLLAWSPSAGAPLAIPGVAHVLELGPALQLLGFDATTGDGLGSTALPLPIEPALQGLTFEIQAFATVASGPSFTNRVTVVLE